MPCPAKANPSNPVDVLFTEHHQKSPEAVLIALAINADQLGDDWLRGFSFDSRAHEQASVL